MGLCLFPSVGSESAFIDHCMFLPGSLSDEPYFFLLPPRLILLATIFYRVLDLQSTAAYGILASSS